MGSSCQRDRGESGRRAARLSGERCGPCARAGPKAARAGCERADWAAKEGKERAGERKGGPRCWAGRDGSWWAAGKEKERVGRKERWVGLGFSREGWAGP